MTPRAEDRAALLNERQKLKMARSAHAYVRGSTAKFYEWLEGKETQLPVGPAIWICGDCHIGNLGPVANAKGHVAIQIRDLDQTVIGNPAHDIIRLALSLASSARGCDLPGVTTARMLEHIIDGYQAALNPAADAERPKPPAPVQGALKAALKRGWRELATERIEGVAPQIPLGPKFWALTKDERHELAQIAHSPEIAALATALHSRADDATVELVDAAYWVKGCSSLGSLRYAALVAVGEGKQRELSLLDIKEARAPAAPRAPSAKMPRDNAQRVIEGARHLSPHLGDRMAASRMSGRAVFVRELLPQDLKLEIETLTEDQATTIGRFLAGVVGKAHARQMDEAERKSWAAELDLHRSKSLDAPSWLWSSVVDLLATHEVAYLDHCRRYARSAA